MNTASPCLNFEIKYYIIGKIIAQAAFSLAFSALLAGRLESGNVIEYFNMRDMFNELGTQVRHLHGRNGTKKKTTNSFFLSWSKTIGYFRYLVPFSLGPK